MHRPAASTLLLLVATTTTANAASDTPATTPADPKRVAEAFVDLCVRAPHAWAAVRTAERLGTVTVTGDAPTAAAATNARFALALGDATAHVKVTDTACGLEVAADAAKTMEALNPLLASVYTGHEVLEPSQPRSAASGHTILRDLYFGREGALHRQNVLAITTGERGLVLARTNVSVATGEPIAMDLAPSEDVTGRAAHPPVYPMAALNQCASGKAVMRVSVDTAGEVTGVDFEQSAGRKDLDSSAEAAARQWRYVPGLVGGALVGGDIRVPVTYTAPCGRR